MKYAYKLTVDYGKDACQKINHYQQ